MMRWIVGSSLRLRRIVVAVAAGVMLLGIVSAKKTPVDLLPEYQPATVEVQTEALGLSAAEVEQLITVPLEQDLLVGVPFLDDISSVSLPGVSSVVMTFEPGTDVLDARQVVQERLTQAVGVAGLPAVAKPPQMIQPVSSSRRVSMLKLTSEKLSPIEMSVLARWVIGPRLMGVPGVANVAVWGNRERQLQVLVDPDRLRAKGVTLPEVVRTAGNALEVSPLSYLEASKPGTGGFIDTPNQRFNIFHEQAITDATELAQVPVESTSGAADEGAGGRLALGELTDVVESHQPLIGDTACGGGHSCLILVIEKFPGTNSGQVADDVDTALAALRPGLGDMRIDSSLYRPASDLDSLFSQLGRALLAGGILLVVVLLVLLRDWRRTAIVLATLAVSLACAVLVLNARDSAREPSRADRSRRGPHRPGGRRRLRHLCDRAPSPTTPGVRHERTDLDDRRWTARWGCAGPRSSPRWSSAPPRCRCSSWVTKGPRSSHRSCCPTSWPSRSRSWWRCCSRRRCA